MEVTLPETVRAELRAWARAARPAEACGLLIGRALPAGLEVQRATQARNLQRDPTRYEIDPTDHLAAQHDARATGLDVIGAWHSHPLGPAQPSDRDQREALPDWLYLIVDGATNDLRAWRMGSAGEFAQLPCVP